MFKKMKCQLCDKDKKLIKAHIFPEFLYKDLSLYSPDKKGQGRIGGIKNTGGKIEFLRKGLPLGIYDSTILCKDCDSITLKEFDDFGKLMFTELIKQRGEKFELRSSEFIEFEVLNYFQLKTFITSLFWRASISKRPEFSIVRLNELESKLKKLFKEKDTAILKEFEIVILYLNNGLTDDYLCNIVEVNKLNTYFYSFIAGGFLINFFPDTNKIFEFWSQFVVKEEKTFKIPIINDIETSKFIINSFIDKEILK
ncbi:MAG: hypothetical protein WD426_00840 [Anditalea sp.]